MPNRKSPDPKAKAVPDLSRLHADGSTRHPEYPSLEGRTPLPEEITGRASATNEDLVELFVNESDAHLEDGFRGGSEDETRDDVDGPDDPRAALKRVDHPEHQPDVD